MTTFREANVNRFNGFGEHYDAFRPAAPAVIPDLLARYARIPAGSLPGLVVDLGCGTGLSTRVWLGRARRITGVEPNDDMRAQAERASAGLPGAETLSFRKGTSTDTGLAEGSADILTCSQCLHWMEPAPTFAEIARVLRPGGVFCAFDYDGIPAVDYEVEEAVRDLRRRVAALEAERRFAPVRKWGKEKHLERIADSGLFRYVRDVRLYSVLTGGAVWLKGFMRSQGGVQTMLGHGMSEEEIGLSAFAEVADRVLGDAEVPLVFGYRARVAVK
ncbi:Methyltransferase type 11 [Desulfovibrio sp. X2]|uniref:class I SAM-dependent methyltransferase n=1 Tax=Desulfovibrio sp. X2 TaxID=941449 RepID=UPI000358DD20|nr:class I SAM-dependent methyltransferase [Desulfovibrio sp. X2]EPR44585.1 Methyltransferase type 11 [Desulfovibrio sp. X2]